MEKENNKKGFDIDKIVIVALFGIIVLLIILIFKLNDNDDKYIYNNTNGNNSNYTANDRIDTTNIKISRDDALDIALKDLNIKASETFDIDIELENKYGSVVYEVNFNSGIHEYEYYIDAKSGEILHSFKEIDY